RQILAAEETVAARNGEGDHDAIADLQLRVLFPDFDHLAHEFVAEHVATFHRRNVAAVDMEVGTADRRRRDSDDGVARIEDGWVGNILDANVLFAIKADALHCGLQSDAVATGISPASSSCLRRRRSSRMVCEGSRPNAAAATAPNR